MKQYIYISFQNLESEIKTEGHLAWVEVIFSQNLIAKYKMQLQKWKARISGLGGAPIKLNLIVKYKIYKNNKKYKSTNQGYLAWVEVRSSLIVDPIQLDRLIADCNLFWEGGQRTWWEYGAIKNDGSPIFREFKKTTTITTTKTTTT